jgi:hypothetical protein
MALPVQAVPRALRAAAPIVAAAGAAVLVIQWAGARMFWLDEEMIAINLRDHTLAQLAGPLELGQTAPYGWLAIQRLVLLAFGTSELTLRFVPVAFGIGTLAAAIWLGRRFMTPVGAAALAFLCAAGQWLSFHALELKHYSADAFWGLFLPALAVWSLNGVGPGSDPGPTPIRGVGRIQPETVDLLPWGRTRVRPGSDPDERADARAVDRRRILVWWIVAACAQWLGNGALFAAPACAAVIVVTSARRAGTRGAIHAALPGVLWLASFALNYQVALAPALANAFLRGYWWNAFPPADAGIAVRIAWVAQQLAPLAIKPGGTGWVVTLWCASAIGLAAAPGYDAVFRATFALVTLSAFLWAAIGLAPMADRLALWIVPAVYVGIAMAAELAAAWLAEGIRRRRWALAAIGATAAAWLVAFGADIYAHGTIYVNLGRHVANHGLDDRGAIAWLARQERDADVWVTTHDALPAWWWYAEPDARAPILEASVVPSALACGDGELGSWLRRDHRRRVLVYLGFGHDTPEEFDDTLLARLGSIGRIAAYRPFGSLGHAIVFELGEPSSNPPTLAALSGQPPAVRPSPREGCIAVTPARRW